MARLNWPRILLRLLLGRRLPRVRGRLLVTGLEAPVSIRRDRWGIPHVDARSWFVGKPAHIQTTAFRNGTLQGAYLMIAARALGLDVGAMSGFDNHKVDEAFFAGTTIRSNFLVNLGHGDPAKVHKRNPRPAFDEACSIV